MHCSDLERYLEACLDGQLGDSRRRALKDHLAYCGGCRERVDGLRQFEAELQRRLRSMQHEVSLWEPLGLETVPNAGRGTGPARSGAPPVALPGVPVVLPALPSRDATGPTAETAGGGLVVRRGHRLRAAPPRGSASTFTSCFGPGLGRRLQGLAGVALIVTAVAAVADLALSGLGWLGGDRRASIYRAYLDGDVELDLRTAEPARLSLWLGEQLGGPVSLPEAPGGFALIGGTAVDTAVDGEAGLAVYANADGPALLLIENVAAGDGSPLATGLDGGNAAVGSPNLGGKVVVEDGLARLDWQDGQHAYSLIGALPADKLALFAD